MGKKRSNLQTVRRDGGYTLLIVMLISATLLTGVMTLAVSGGFAFRTMTAASKTSDTQYNADILANKAYQLALKEIYSQFQNSTDVAHANGMSLSIPLTTTNDSVLINTDIISTIKGTDTETIQGQTLQGQYYIQYMPTPPPSLPNQDTYYLQAVGHIGNQTSVINFMASFTSGPSVPTSYNPYPQAEYLSRYVFDSGAVTQIKINADLNPFTSTNQAILSLAPDKSSSPVDLNLQPNEFRYNTPLVYGANGNMQALVAGNVSVGTKDALVVEGDLVANQLSLQPNSIVKVYGNLYASNITLSTDSILIVHGNLLSTGPVNLNNQSSVVVNGSAQIADSLTLGVGNGSTNTNSGENSVGTSGNSQGNGDSTQSKDQTKGNDNNQGNDNSNNSGSSSWSWNGNGNSSDGQHTNAMFDARKGITVVGSVSVDKFSAIQDSSALTVGQSLADNGFVGAVGDVNVQKDITVGGGGVLYADANLGASSLSLDTTGTVDVNGTATLALGEPQGSSSLGWIPWQSALGYWVSGLSTFDGVWDSSAMWTWNPWPQGYSGGDDGGKWLDEDDNPYFQGWSSKGDLSQFFQLDGMFDYGTWIFSHYLSPPGFHYGAFVQGVPPSVGPITLTALERLN